MCWNVSEGITGDENAKVNCKAELCATSCRENQRSAKTCSRRSRRCWNYRRHWEGSKTDNQSQRLLKVSGLCEQTKPHPGGFWLQERFTRGRTLFIASDVDVNESSQQQPLPAKLLSFGAEILSEKVLELSISLISVEQTKLPVCASTSDFSNPNGSLRLVNQSKHLVTTKLPSPSFSAQ